MRNPIIEQNPPICIDRHTPSIFRVVIKGNLASGNVCISDFIGPNNRFLSTKIIINRKIIKKTRNPFYEPTLSASKEENEKRKDIEKGNKNPLNDVIDDDIDPDKP